MTLTAPPTTAPDSLDTLAAALDGSLVRPGDPTWDEARRAWDLAVDQRPAAVVLAASPADVVATVRTAAALGLRVAPQSTGHNAAPLGDLTGTVLLRTSRLRDVHIDPGARTARVGGGAVWADVTPAAAAHGLAGLAGSAADVGVVGYTLGGGLSWLGRTHGLAANSVVAVELVTADGQLRRVDADHDPDLFWALRGGGGSVGVVTSVEFRLYPITEVYAGVLFFPAERAAEVLTAWRDWLPAVPDAVTSVGRLLDFPPLPDLPPHLAGRSFVVVEVICQLPPAEADALLAPLRALGPELDTVRPTPMTELSQLHMDPPGPVPGCGDGALLAALPDAALAGLVAAADAVRPALLSIELRHLGGALRPGLVEAGVVDGLDGEFALFTVGIAPTPEAYAAVHAAIDAVHAALGPWYSDRGYLNFCERAVPGEALFGAAAGRLRQVKAAYDPADVIRSNHPVTGPVPAP